MDYAAEYGRMHEKGKYFPGFSISPYVPTITRLVEKFQPERLLDYGCGRGLQYLKRRVHEDWGGPLPHCYDIGVRGLDEKPEGMFDGVLCTDVLEHITKADLPGVIAELVRYTRPAGFLFLVISCRPSRKKLPSGGDVHVTVEPPSWWKEFLTKQIGGSPIHLLAAFDVAGHFDEADHAWELTI